MNTILQKRIEEKSKELAQKYFPNEMNIWARPNYEAQYVESACKEIVTFALQNQWISVEESLPVLVDKKSGQSEVVFARVEHDNVFVAYYDYSNEHWYYNNHYGYDPQIYYKITHWMPIPQLKGGEE